MPRLRPSSPGQSKPPSAISNEAEPVVPAVPAKRGARVGDGRLHIRRLFGKGHVTLVASREGEDEDEDAPPNGTFNASPAQVYDTLMNTRKHAALSGEKAKISRKVGGRFTAWGDHISGFNLALQPGRKIVQAWRATGW